jgi:glycosyltransferase involved in cell wall biosynthesis
MGRVAVFHNTLDLRGGADAVCVHTCAALARDHRVTLFTVSAADPGAVAAGFDVDLDVEVVQPPGSARLAGAFAALGPYLGPQLAARTALLRSYFARRAEEYDVAVSTANELSLPLPSVQYVHFPQFHLDRTEAGDRGRLGPLWSRLAAPDRAELDGRADLVANSAWTADVVEEVYGTRPAVCHPPVDAIEGRPWADRERGVLVLGRIAPDKRTLEALDVVENLRERGYDLTCHIVGSAPPSYRTYVRAVRRAAAARPYVTLETDVSRKRVHDLLGRYRYGLNAKPREHFGMAVAEYVAAGMLPFVPEDGGQADVVDGDDRLLFDGVEPAAERIAAAIEDDLRPFLPRDRFGRERFAAELREHVATRLQPVTRD